MSQSSITSGDMGFQTRCPTCSAAIPFNPEDIIITCEYCGSLITLTGEAVPNHILLENRMSKEDIVELIKDWLPSSIKDNIKLINIHPYLIPYWVIHVKANTYFSGYFTDTEYEERTRTEWYTDANGNQKSRTVTEQIPVTVYKPVKRKINEDGARVLLARKGASFYGQDVIERTILSLIPQSKPFTLDAIKNMGKEVKFLAGEIEESDAREIIATQTRTDHRSQAHSATTELFDCRTQLTTLEAKFLHYPFWFAEYKFKGKSYRVALDGFKETVLKGEQPVTIKSRILNYSLSMLFLFFGAVLTQYTTIYTTQDGFPFAPIIIGLIMGVFTIFFYRKAWKIEKEKKGRRK